MTFLEFVNGCLEMIENDPSLGDLIIHKRTTEGCDVCNPYFVSRNEEIYNLPMTDIIDSYSSEERQFLPKKVMVV